MKTEFKIDRRFPPPKPFPGKGRRLYPFGILKVGESFGLPDRAAFDRASRAAYMYGYRHSMAFTADVYALRIWRVK